MLSRVNRLSRQAKLMLLAHKLDGIQDLMDTTPHRWDEFRVRNWFKWAKQVFENVRGMHMGLENTLTDVLRKVHENKRPRLSGPRLSQPSLRQWQSLARRST